MSNEKFKPPYTAYKILPPKIVKKTVSICELDSWPRDLNADFALWRSLFGGVKLTENTDPDKCGYSGYDIAFNTQIEYSLPDSSVGENVITFWYFLSVRIDNKGKSILILVKDVTQGLNHTLAAETQFSNIFTRSAIKSCLSLNYNGNMSVLFVNATKIYQFKAKNIPCI